MIRKIFGLYNFSNGCMSTNEVERSGCSIEATTMKIIIEIYDLGMGDKRLKVRGYLKWTCIYCAALENDNALCMMDVSLLTDYQQRDQSNCSRDSLQLFWMIWQENLGRLVTSTYLRPENTHTHTQGAARVESALKKENTVSFKRKSYGDYFLVLLRNNHCRKF